MRKLTSKDLKDLHFLKHYRIIRKWACKTCDLKDADLELLIYLDAIEFFNELKLPVVLVLTKVDQLKNQKMRSQRRKEVKKILDDNKQLVYEKVFWCSVKDFKSVKDIVLHIKNSKKED